MIKEQKKMFLEKTKEKAKALAQLLESKKGLDIVLLDVSEKTPIADIFVLVSSDSFIHSKALEDYAREFLEKEGYKRLNPLNTFAENPWVLLDYGDIIVHIFKGEARAYYDIEKLWFDTKKIELGE